MKKLRFVVSLTTRDNDYQIEQAQSADEAARRLGAELQLLYAENDAILQSQQLLKIIQSTTEPHPDGIIFEPVGGTALPQVARAAAAAGIGWVVLNREVEYIDELRHAYKLPIFSISSDHEQIGRIQGEQIKALLPKGGSILLVQGPAESLAAKQRTSGAFETKPAEVQVKLMKANWTEAGAYKSVSSWLKLSTSQHSELDLIAAQDDSMAIGARKAFQELSDSNLRAKWIKLPFLGIDGVRLTGQAWVRQGLLRATIVVPANTGKALEMLSQALQSGTLPPPKTLTTAKSFPSVDELAKRPIPKGQAAKA
ncbi:MAG TPA: sugar ABC transporter substrate-binding protein [Terriglobales bacterium]|nr:sugar ABC transporter substrate-binding protein [Terriglobales bacterium]